MNKQLKIFIKGGFKAGEGQACKDDKNITVYVRDVYVNNKECESIIAEEIAPGKKARSEIIFMDFSLEEIGIKDTSEIEEVKLYISVCDTKEEYSIFNTDVLTLTY